MWKDNSEGYKDKFEHLYNIEKSGVTQTYAEGEAVCPHCGFVQYIGGNYEHVSDENRSVHCKGCEQDYVVRTDVDVRYYYYTHKEDNNEEVE